MKCRSLHHLSLRQAAAELGIHLAEKVEALKQTPKTRTYFMSRPPTQIVQSPCPSEPNEPTRRDCAL